MEQDDKQVEQHDTTKTLESEAISLGLKVVSAFFIFICFSVLISSFSLFWYGFATWVFCMAVSFVGAFLGIEGWTGKRFYDHPLKEKTNKELLIACCILGVLSIMAASVLSEAEKAEKARVAREVERQRVEDLGAKFQAQQVALTSEVETNFQEGNHQKVVTLLQVYDDLPPSVEGLQELRDVRDKSQIELETQKLKKTTELY